MSKGAFAKEEVMQEYLSALLTDDTPVVQAKVQESAVQHLFDKISVPQAEPTPQVPLKNRLLSGKLKKRLRQSKKKRHHRFQRRPRRGSPVSRFRLCSLRWLA
ncbi:hypothetical protein ACFQMB_04925 [Pseudobowmanella zhangzhouensis]|uniref:hypothetical protein n=1 Tax=Pseudobowmanella zhangzhouensis TaxID=1537679 RepID=UPI0036168940